MLGPVSIVTFYESSNLDDLILIMTITIEEVDFLSLSPYTHIVS